MASIFLSYSRADRPKAQAVAEALKEEGLTVWWDKVLRAGQTYDEVTEGMLRDAAAVIVLWSTTSVKSKWVRAEATLGQRSSALIPAMIEDAERPIMFELTQSADLIGWEGDRTDPRWVEFVADVKRVLPQVTEQPSQAAASPVQDPPTAPQATAALPDTTMELTFWTSIKDQRDAADFEAYLRRYPDGHYADLARNRLAAIEQAEARAALMAQPPSAAPASPLHPLPASRPAASNRAEAPAARGLQAKPAKPPARSERSAPARQSSSVPILVSSVIAVIILGGAVSLMLPRPDMTGAPGTQTMELEARLAADTQSAALPEPGFEAPAPDEPRSPNEPEESEDTLALREEAPPPAPACEVCPEMVPLAHGTFLMGSPAGEPGRAAFEGPQREVTVAPFSISQAEITIAQWAACVAEGGCGGYSPRLTDDGDFPVGMVSWRDANAYTAWLTQKTGKTYRLPTEAEWEYAARGGTSTAYWWGDQFDASKAPRDRVRSAASLPANGFGLAGMTGNVAEWVEDCYVNTYANAPTDGRAVLAGDCSRRVVRGGAVNSSPNQLRIANRSRIVVTTRDRQIGFRVVTADPPD